MNRPIGLAIIGAQKAGTSSLARYLEQHPHICSHARPELTCFLDGPVDSRTYPAIFQRHFRHCPSDAVVLLKNVGVLDRPTAVDRLWEHNPRMRLVVLLRRPVERAYSAYWYARRMGWEDQPTFGAALHADPRRFPDDVARRNCAYVARGEFARHLRAVYGRFPRGQVRVFLFEELRTAAVGVCQQVFEFAGVDPSFVPKVASWHNVSARPRSVALVRAFATPRLRALRRMVGRLLPGEGAQRLRRLLICLNEAPFTPPPIDPALRCELLAHFCPHNQELAALLGRDLPGWDQ